jgi:hypothetical protein
MVAVHYYFFRDKNLISSPPPNPKPLPNTTKQLPFFYRKSTNAKWVGQICYINMYLLIFDSLLIVMATIIQDCILMLLNIIHAFTGNRIH